MRRRCRAPSCGRFVGAEEDFCPAHADPEPDDELLSVEIEALRHVMQRVKEEVQDVELQARLLPRIVSVSIQAIRARHQIGGHAMADIMTALRPTLEDLDREMKRHTTSPHVQH